MKIFLYVKQHILTGLKYFGKTENDNPITYPGSGVYWDQHIKKHGREYVKTIELWEFNDQEECTKFALQFSNENDIVKSKEWANLREENGLDGNPKGIIFSEEARKNMGKHRKGKKLSQYQIDAMKRGRLEKPITQETKYKISQTLTGRKASDETKAKMSKMRKGKAQLWVRTEEYKRKQSLAQKGRNLPQRSLDHCKALAADKLGKRYYHNGQQQIFTRDQPPENWIRGRLPPSINV